MEYSSEQIKDIVLQIMSNLENEPSVSNKSHLGVFDDMNDAIAAAKEASKIMRHLSMDSREQIIENIRRKTIEHAETMARMAVEETGMGNVGDKILKHQLLAEKTPGTEDIETGVWSGDRGVTLVEMGPFGVVGALAPSTNPSETILGNCIGMIAAGNSVVFNAHPGALKTSNFAVNLVNEASIEAGGPENVCTAVAKPSNDTGSIIMGHKDIQLIVATGGPGVVSAVLSSGKRGIGAGAGNPPVLVDDTADIKQAAEDIVNGASFDNNLPCISEEVIVAIDKIVDELTYYLIENGCYVANKDEQDRLVQTVMKDGRLNRDCVGRDAPTLLRKTGIEPPEGTRLIIFEGEKEHPLITNELMMPILGIVRAKDIDDAIEKAVWLEHGNRHSAHMHSKNIDNLTRFGKEVDTAIFVKNAPSYAGIGFGGEGFCTYTIASRTGEGLTSARTFTKQRRCVMADSLSIR